MFKFLKKKKKEEETAESGEEAEREEKLKEAPQKSNSETKSSDLVKISTELDRIKASIEALQEVRKSFTERFTRISEQIGELRSMILDRDRTIQEIELKAVKASDLVNSIKPEKLLTEVQKQDVKIEALKANLEGNEAIMDRIMEELREIRNKLKFFSGLKEIVKLSEEVKKELIEIKKVEGTISADSDKVETIYSEMRKKLQDIDTFKSQLQEIKANIDQNMKDVDFLKNKVMGLAEKDELEKLTNKVQRYVEALKEIEKKSSLTKDLEELKTLLEGIK